MGKLVSFVVVSVGILYFLRKIWSPSWLGRLLSRFFFSRTCISVWFLSRSVLTTWRNVQQGFASFLWGLQDLTLIFNHLCDQFLLFFEKTHLLVDDWIPFTKYNALFLLNTC
jgi:hypothetical protein